MSKANAKFTGAQRKNKLESKVKKTFNQALEIAKKGNWDKAWKVAQEDDGLLPEVTKSQWIEFAKKAIERRKMWEKNYK